MVTGVVVLLLSLELEPPPPPLLCPVIMMDFSPYIPEPSLAVARTVTVPLAVAVSRPELLMLAPLPLEIDHVTVLLVAFTG